MAGSEEKLQSILMKIKEESERASYKLNIKKKTKIMVSRLHYFMANRRGKVEVVIDLLFLGSKITADSDCSHEIRRQLLLGKKAMTNLDSVLKSRDITLPKKVHIVKGYSLPSVHVQL